MNRVKMVRFLYDANMYIKVVWGTEPFQEGPYSPERFCCVGSLGVMVKTKYWSAERWRNPKRDGGRVANWLSTAHPGRRRAH